MPWQFYYRAFSVVCWLHPVHNEINQNLGFDGSSLFKINQMSDNSISHLLILSEDSLFPKMSWSGWFMSLIVLATTKCTLWVHQRPFAAWVPTKNCYSPLVLWRRASFALSFNMNLFKSAILAVNFWIYFLDCRGFMCTIALILSGLASIPFTNTRYPTNFPLCTPVTHFLDWVLGELHACLWRSQLNP
jgi:hypothetical protein